MFDWKEWNLKDKHEKWNNEYKVFLDWNTYKNISAEQVSQKGPMFPTEMLLSKQLCLVLKNLTELSKVPLLKIIEKVD